MMFNNLLKVIDKSREKKTKYLGDLKRFYLKRKGLKIVDSSELYSLLSDNRSKTCHIIGSGWSLNDSIDLTKSGNAFVMGNNNAAIADIKFDIYFVEFGGFNNVELSKFHIKLIDKIVSKNCKYIYFKNVWESKNDVKFIIKHWGNKVEYIKDYLIKCSSEERLNSAMKNLLTKDNKYVKQYSSTVLTFVGMAYNAGFKNIVIHGVDFGGNYFFEEPEFNHVLEYLPPKKETDKSFVTIDDKKVHITSKSKLGVKEALKVISKLLNEEGVNLYSASAVSPLSKILPVYSTNS